MFGGTSKSQNLVVELVCGEPKCTVYLVFNFLEVALSGNGNLINAKPHQVTHVCCHFGSQAAAMVGEHLKKQLSRPLLTSTPTPQSYELQVNVSFVIFL